MAAAYYYIDYTNGNDARSGLRIPAGDYNSVTYSSVDSTADTTHFVDADLTGADDYINGSYFYNVTRGLGSIIDDFVASSDTATLHTAITGMTAGDTYYILDSWKTLPQYTSVSVRTAGDIAYVRANQTHTYNSADIAYDEDGNTTSPISLLGCTSTIDPWHDSSSTRPDINFGAAAYKSNLSGDDFWSIKNLKFSNSTATNGPVYFQMGVGLILDNCYFDSGSATNNSFYLTQSMFFQMTNCAVVGTYMFKASIGSCVGTITNCSFDCVTDNDSAYLIFLNTNRILFETCTFGTNKKPSTGALYMYPGGHTFLRNCTFVETGSAWSKICLFGEGKDSSVYIMDKNTTVGSSETHMYGGVVYNSTTVRTGGATSSAKMMPSSACNTKYVMTVRGNDPYDFAVYCPASATTITMYIRSEGVWGGSYPTNSELYMETTYHNSASVGTMATATSTQVLADGTTWVAFTNTFTPAIAGYVYVRIYLKKYVAACGCYVDIKPVVS